MTDPNRPLACILLFICTLFLIPPSSWGKDSTERLEQELILLKSTQESQGRVIAETAQQIGQLRQEVQELKGQIEETKHFFQEESGKNGKLLRDFDLRLTSMEERLTLFETQLQEFLSRPSEGQKRGGEEEEFYRRGLAELNAQNHKAAFQIFDQFLQKYPASKLTANAQYWKGETLYAMKQFQESVLEFQKVIKKYPKSDKAPAAVLKQGYSFFEMKQYLEAKAFLQKVVTDYPRSEEAIKAGEKMQQIDQLLAKAPFPPNSPQTAPTTEPMRNP